MLNKLLKLFKEIDNANDLKKNKLTRYDYDVVFRCIRDLFYENSTSTFNKAAAEWFRRGGAKVRIDEDEINYIISLDN